ncbi:alpha/beta fold hydrolase [Streptomyces sp. WAC06614]|uniref:alpha/beta fold hydrolase n=1 Tax=Streptomyces sp. WAC06614 TaxID=2487416 RepID=UPI00163BA617|nr:alpha/beta fold hydrolase [Streptomyces sp. WAC06614]
MAFTGVGWRAGLVVGTTALLATALPTVTTAAAAPAAVAPAAVAPEAAPAAVAGGARTPWCPQVEDHRVDCGQVDRPWVAGRADLGTVKVSWAVVRHRDPGPAKGTVAVNPGGPGEVAIGKAGAFALGMRDLLRDHDLLLVDPRGTGESERLPCGLTDAELRLGTRREQREAVVRCARELGPRAAGYTTAATADDIDAVRDRLGVPRLTLYGLSYGTYLMPVYASRHPERVRSLVLSGAYPLAFDPLSRPSAQAVSLALRRVCDRSAGPGGRPACDGAKAVRDLAAAAAELRARPVEVEVPVEGLGTPHRLLFTEGRLAGLAYESASNGSGLAADEPSLLGDLPHALDRFVQGDRAPLVRLVQQDLAHASDADQAPYVAVTCNDYRKPWSVDASVPERWRQYRSALAGARPGSFGAFGPQGYLEGPTDGGDLCIGWPREHAPAPQPVHPRLPDVPVLVLSGDLDANTPDANGRLAAGQFEDSRFLSVRNARHVPEQADPACVFGVTTRFVRTGRTGDTSCLGALPPVAVTPVRR